MSRPPASDQAQREAAVRERARNVLVDAGAGTGKTTILVERLVEMVAPTTGAAPVPIHRLAAITFTRKAAGELRLRIREHLLAALAERGLPPAREAALRQALADLDAAWVGTIHSFADRLLRLRPVEAALSPAYEIVEDEEDLVRETWDVLMHAFESGTLEAELGGTPAAGRAAEAATTLALAVAAELRSESRETEFRTAFGLDALVGGFVRSRDVPPADAPVAAFDLAAFRAAAADFLAAAQPVRSASPGARWITATAGRLAALQGVTEPAVLFRELRRALAARPRNLNKRDGFAGDDVAWKAWRRIEDTTLPALRAPLDRWMATRLARLFPVVVTLYEKVKARRQVLDQLDLLVKLRDLLRDRREVRREFQALFDHIFVDEFQDTDPLQAEIVLYLCERGAEAERWEDIILRDGALTLVGDPKQSIYRFRRADVAMYDRVRQVVQRGTHLAVTLSASFRSVPALIPWLNDRFALILGRAPDGRPFDPATGVVFHQPLAAGRPDGHAVPVHVLPADFDDGRQRGADQYRDLEGQALARYLRWLVEAGDVRIADPLTGRLRRVQYGDVAILAVSTWNLPRLFPFLDREGVPYASRGGTLFVGDPLSRQFLLGLRALADRDDGVAEAALLRPPFFALDPGDLLRARAAAAGRVPEDDAVRRVREARALIAELRRRRLERPTGATARDLLDRTALGRAVARGPNGAQRLARLRELCLVLEQTAAAESLDYDAATARLRRWVDEPVQLDPPHPVGGEAVQVLTVHQAKGLEFPVVVLWDGRGLWNTRLPHAPWRMERDGRGWTMALDGLDWEEPAGLALGQTERAYLEAERRRVIYVAATRARDLLVIPRTGTPKPGQMICADLLAGAERDAMRVLDVFRPGTGASWARQVTAGDAPAPREAAEVEREIAARWEPSAREAARPRFRPVAVSEARAGRLGREHQAPGAAGAAGGTAGTPHVAEGAAGAPPKAREGRFGHVFGSAVHQALGLLLRDPALGPAAAVRLAAARVSLNEHLEEATADVARAWRALEAERLARPPGPDLQLEYPVAGLLDDGTLLVGYVDLLAVQGDELIVLDFKTDAPPAGDVEAAYPEYVAQVRLYRRLLEAAGLSASRRPRPGLLFTADGLVRWLAAGMDGSLTPG